MSEPFDIVTTVSPDFRPAFDAVFRPTWENAGAANIVVHCIDEGSWPANILRRAEILRDEVLSRTHRLQYVGGAIQNLPPTIGPRLLALDADCIVLRPLGGMFDQRRMMSVSRWPNVNMGVVAYDVDRARPTTWGRLLDGVVRDVGRHVARRIDRDPNPMLECDQAVWRSKLWGMEPRIGKVPEWIWNYSNFDLPQWKIELPDLQPILRVLHIKGHGDWKMAKLDEKIAYAKTLWPKELACLETI